MVLTIDIGNTNITLGGYFANGELSFQSRMATDTRLEADQYALQVSSILQLYGVGETIDGVALSSVVPALTAVLVRAMQHITAAKPMVLSTAVPCGVAIDIENPAELGGDLLAGAIAVLGTWDLPAVIVDMGTATKITALDKGGVLRGVAIAPGLFLSMNTLVKGASLLHGISLVPPKAAIGRNTAESLRSGILYGNAAMLDGMVERFSAEMGGAATVVATGGASQTVLPYCKTKMTYCGTLVLDGLYRAHKMNC